MRHAKQKNQPKLRKGHRLALMANLSSALFIKGKIKTTKAKAKALRPFSEKIITLAKKAEVTEDCSKKLHYRRLAIARIRSKKAVNELFNNKVSEFTNRCGGYTRIYKLAYRRKGDAAEMALIELINKSDNGYKKSTNKKKIKKSLVIKNK